MANDRHWDVFQCFYWGQDRFGAWPFLLARLVSFGLRGAVRWEHLQFALVAWFLLGAVALARL
jgi:hypothetical protein